eukprot:scaffold5929_cov81-Cylindrotheca_fusiformis.AAC.3
MQAVRSDRSDRRSGARTVRERREWRTQHWPKDIILKPLLRQTSAGLILQVFGFGLAPNSKSFGIPQPVELTVARSSWLPGPWSRPGSSSDS